MSPLFAALVVTIIAGPPIQSPSPEPQPTPAAPTPPKLPADDETPATSVAEPEPSASVPDEPVPQPEPAQATDLPAAAVPERPKVVLPPEFPATVDPYDETTWADLSVEQKDRLRALRASAAARAAEAAEHDDPAVLRERAYARELREVRDARRDRERDDVQQGRRRGRVIAWARPRLVGFGVSLGGGLLLSTIAVPVARTGRVGAAAALGTIGGLGMMIGLPGVIATALIRSAHLRLDDPVDG
jgi:hypothetical protein